MSYKVLSRFREKHHDNTVYEAGDPYPKEGFKADAKRVSFLQKKHSVYGVRFLDEKKSAVQNKKSDAK